MNTRFYSLLTFIILPLFLIFWFPKSSEAYTDLSTYKIQTGKFSGEERAQSALNQLQKDTGWSGQYEATGEYEKYYQIVTGGFSGQQNVRNVLQEFKKTTNIPAFYAGLGDPQYYYQLITGGFSGEEKVKKILGQLKNATGIDGTYYGIGNQQDYYQIISGAFSGQSKVKSVIEQFESETGIQAFYIGLGNLQDYYQVISGGFSGEAKVKDVLDQFEDSTNINANYVSIGNNRYQIISDPVLGLKQANKGRDFFKNNGWSVTYKPTGQNGYERYQVKSVPVLGMEMVNKGRGFFASHNWSVTFQSTGNTGYERFQIKSDLILGMDLVNKGRQFFKNNSWSVTYQSTGIIGYDRYQIKSLPILGMAKVNQARQFFKSHNWSVTYYETGNLQNYYQIVIKDVAGYNQAATMIQKVNQLYGWISLAVKTQQGPQLMYTDYGMTLSSMLDTQMPLFPQTDLHRNDPRYVYAAYVDMDQQIITADGVNLRTKPSMDGPVVEQLNKGDSLLIIGKTGDWVEVRLTWQNANAADVSTYLNPNNFSIDGKDYFQFLKLSQPANFLASEINEKILNGKGILANKGQTFIDAAEKYKVNEMYLISHSLLETGNGTSVLAKGVEYNGRIVYNMYGYGAFDACPVSCGAKKAYENGWFTPEEAIIGGAQLISQEYIYNKTFQQDTLYKMRWNPVATWHQYATDIAWAYKQVSSIYNLYRLLDNYTVYFDIPEYR